MTVSGSRRYHAGIIPSGVFDVDVLHIWLHHLISFQCVLLALYEICKVKYCLEVIAVEILLDLYTAGSYIAVDVLLILMKKDDIVGFGVVHEFTQTGHNLVFVWAVVLAAFWHEEAEHTDISGFHQMCQVYSMFV